jgi:hypothetical protein
MHTGFTCQTAIAINGHSVAISRRDAPEFCK